MFNVVFAWKLYIIHKYLYLQGAETPTSEEYCDGGEQTLARDGSERSNVSIYFLGKLCN